MSDGDKYYNTFIFKIFDCCFMTVLVIFLQNYPLGRLLEDYQLQQSDKNCKWFLLRCNFSKFKWRHRFNAVTNQDNYNLHNLSLCWRSAAAVKLHCFPLLWSSSDKLHNVVRSIMATLLPGPSPGQQATILMLISTVTHVSGTNHLKLMEPRRLSN